MQPSSGDVLQDRAAGIVFSTIRHHQLENEELTMSEIQQQAATTSGIGISTPGIHHIALRVSDFERARRFYIDTLGFPVALEAENIFLFMAGNTAVGIRGPEDQTPEEDVFDPFRVGLDHVALGCEDEAELERVARALEEAGIENTGVKLDETLGKKYVAFKDPDRISWEFYMV